MLTKFLTQRQTPSKPRIIGNRRLLQSLCALIALQLSTAAQADDIDVYAARYSAAKKPNILFVLDYSESMGSSVNGEDVSASNPAKITILKNTMKTVLDDNVERINAGIGSLYGDNTSGIRWPISELSADASSVDPAIPEGSYTVRDIIMKQVEERGANGTTATVDALVEAAQYFRGDPVTHNDIPDGMTIYHEPHQWDEKKQKYYGGNSNAAIAASYSPSNAFDMDHSKTYYCNDYSGSGGPNYCAHKNIDACEVRGPDDELTEGFERLSNLWGSYQRCQYLRSSSWVGARYNSPIVKSCQANAIILISDGQPTRINDGDSLRSIIGYDSEDCEDLSASIFQQYPGSARNGNCGPEVVHALAQWKQNPKFPNSYVTTYTVGFDIDGPGKDYLTLLAQEGDGSFFEANDPQDLDKALTTILDNVLGASENLSQLSIGIDKAHFSHDNRVFFNLFAPSSQRAWNGNLKGYFLNDKGLMDLRGKPATASTGGITQFSDSAQSFWSEKADGNKVGLGGASEQITSGSRMLLTYLDDTIPSEGAALASSARHQLNRFNSAITTEMLGLSTDAATQRDNALDWIQKAPMGDPLHSQSVTVRYPSKQVVFTMTNQGLLHAIDATEPSRTYSGAGLGGEELFAFMPRRLLKNLPDLSMNQSGGEHIYGLDGNITRWHDDLNNDGIVNNDESLLLIFGMRRGGNAYYALDVSNPALPRLQWMIDGNHPDFPQLAQSWSRLSLVSVNDNGTPRKVLAFAAGYDANIQDTASSPTPSLGAAIYMVDNSGQLLWSVSENNHEQMRYSIASDLTLIDTDQNGLADRLYVGDVAGQVWRVDFSDITNAPHVFLLASLNDAQQQPFFYPPSVAYNEGLNGPYYSVSLGSGNRTDPLNLNTQHFIYMLKDPMNNANHSSLQDQTIGASNLYDATANDIASDDRTLANEARELIHTSSGWKVALSVGEKALSSLVSFEGHVLATTFQAQPPSHPDDCGWQTKGRFYSMDIETAQPIPLFEPSRTATNAPSPSRYIELQSAGIPSSPLIVFPKGSGTVNVMVDKQTLGPFDQKLAHVFWHSR